MSTLEHIRDGFSQALDSLAEGWHELRRRASHALTRFHPDGKNGHLDTAEAGMLERNCRWGFLAAEVRESDTEVVVKLEVPGMDSENFEVQVVENFLVVRGEKHLEREEQSGRYYLVERAYGNFERAIPLPTEVDEAHAMARYKRGVLHITLPKSRVAQSRRIEIKPG